VLFLVSHPSLPKRIQIEAASAEEACSKLYFDFLSERLQAGTFVSECLAVPMYEPSEQDR